MYVVLYVFICFGQAKTINKKKYLSSLGEKMMCKCSACKYSIVDECSVDISCQVRTSCMIHPEYGRFILYGNGCDQGSEQQ